MGRCLRTTPWNNNDLGVAPGTAEIRTSITSSIFARMGPVRSILVFTHRVDVNGVVTRKNQETARESDAGLKLLEASSPIG